MYKGLTRCTERAGGNQVIWPQLVGQIDTINQHKKKMYKMDRLMPARPMSSLSPVLTPACAMIIAWRQATVSKLSGCRRQSRAAGIPGMEGAFGMVGPHPCSHL